MTKKWTQQVRNDEHSHTFISIYVPSDLVRYKPVNKVIYEMRNSGHLFSAHHLAARRGGLKLQKSHKIVNNNLAEDFRFYCIVIWEQKMG